jgi:hypothetical protein
MEILMTDITHETITLAVMKGLENYDKRRKEEIEKMCEQNVEIALGRHTKECPGASKGNITGMGGLGIGVSLIIERLFSYFHKGG